MSDKYILDENGNAVAEPDVKKWAQWFDTAERQVARDDIGNTWVSTVFLALNHNFTSQGSPTLWETMIFGGEHDQYQERYSSLKDAREGHARAVAMVLGGVNQ